MPNYFQSHLHTSQRSSDQQTIIEFFFYSLLADDGAQEATYFIYIIGGKSILVKVLSIYKIFPFDY